ncbi:PREDICTED: transcription factor bHLH36-like isoform X4 [Ipomoea nil]|uniref:transcription factor bHLH36-like isoform X4 n=1 Tax=Ipomoea nil TaxID=35883 RepID=UPI0009016F03|nr:PREDICTED: transcription factor bHLH36-like isoform X4 [Ipomoea nil]
MKKMASRLPKTSPKLERKYVEKNRRNQLKTLYKHLFSLLPPHLSQEGMALHDQVDETVKYIRWLQNEVEKNKQKKEELQKMMMMMNSSSRKRPHYSSCDDHRSSPLIQVLDIGPGTHVVLVNDLEGVAGFHNIIRILHQHGLEVANATFQQHGNSMLQVVHQQGFGGTMLSEKLKQVLYGSSCPEETTEQQSSDSWEDYDIWGFHSLEPFQELQYPPPY